VIEEGINGTLVESIDEAIEAVRHIDGLDRQRVRANFDVRFSAARQAEDYEQLYRHLIQARRSQTQTVVPMLHAA